MIRPRAERGCSGRGRETSITGVLTEQPRDRRERRREGDKSNKLNLGAECWAKNNYGGDIVAITEGCTSELIKNTWEGFRWSLTQHPASGRESEKKVADALHR